MKLDFRGPVSIHFRKFEESWLNKPVFQLFSEVVQRNPDKIALKCDNQQLTYQEVYQWAITIAIALQKTNATKEPVGIALPNNVFFPVAMLASLATGCPYVPLDIDLPIARNRLIIEQSGLKCIITTTDTPVFETTLTSIYIDNLTISDTALNNVTASADNIAYIIYTSGSTGVPKGVYQNQRNLLHDVMQYTNSVHLSDNDRLTLLYSPSVNGAIRDIYGALLNGATLIIKNLKKTGFYNLDDFISQEKITIYHSIPNIFRTFLKLNPEKAAFSSVRLIYLAGDRIYNTDVDLYKSFFQSDCLLYVGIGATEIATIYRQWFINHETVINQELIPLGYAVADRTMQLLDEAGQPVPDGEAGEITVSSPFISLGYWKNPEQTALSFSIKPHDTTLRTFRTGDLGRINSEGLLEFLGRKDNQVKINGYRVELSEIEGILMNHPSIERCGVVLHTTDKHNSMFAFYISHTQIPEIILKNWLSEKLPAYMIPQRCIQVDEIPLLHNFKNDSKALKLLAEALVSTPQTGYKTNNAEQDYIYTTLRQVWSKFLDEHSFDKNIRWKDAGGDSLNAVNFLVQLESDLNTTLPTDWIHGEMSPEEIHTFLQGLNTQKQASHENIIYIFPALKGIAEATRVFLKKLAEHATIRIITYPKISDTHPDNRNLAYATEYILQQMPKSYKGNIGMFGICTGAIIMNHIITSTTIEQNSIIGIIEGIEKYRKKPFFNDFFEKTVSFFKRGDLFNNTINFFYNHSEFIKRIIHKVEKNSNQTLKIKNNQTFLWHIYNTHTPSYFAGKLLYFGCNNSTLDKNGAHWKPYFKEVEPIELFGEHLDMLNEQNAEIVLAKLLDEITQPIVVE